MPDEPDPVDKTGDDEADDDSARNGRRRSTSEIAIAVLGGLAGVVTAVTGLIYALNGSGGPT